MLKRTALFLALCLTALISPWARAQTTQIVATHISYFGGTTVTGTFCLTPTNQAGQPINLVTSLGQQVSPQVPLCFPITSGVLSSSAIVPDTSTTQPVNACYNAVVNNYYGQQVAVFPCIQPSGATWSFDAYIPSSTPSIPALSLPQYQVNGTPLSNQSLLNFVGSGVSPGTGGAINIASGGSLPTAAGSNEALLSTGAGTSYAAGQVILPSPSGPQNILQALGANYGTSLNVNSLNNIFYVDGFSAYGGVGAGVVAWTSGVNTQQCQVVSYSGSYYINLSAATSGATTPGSYYPVWYPVTNNAAATAADCAWYMAESYKRQNHQSYAIGFGAARYTSNQSFVDYVDGNTYDDEFSVSAWGCGTGCTYVTYAGSAAVPVFSRPGGAGNSSSMELHDMTVDGGALASAAIQLGFVGQAGSYFYNLNLGHVAPGSDHVLELGLTYSDSFQVFTNAINIGVYPDGGTQNCGVFTANVVAGSITSYTVNSGGNCYNTYSGSTELTVVSLRGYQGGSATQPCTVMPDPPTATIVSHAVTAITPGAGTGSGCDGTHPIDVQVYQTPNVNYGAILNASDSTYEHMISYSGSIGAFNVAGGDNGFIHLHPSVVPNGIIDSTGGGHFSNTEIDDVGGYGFQITEPYANAGTTISQTHTYIGGSRLLPGSATYYLATTTAATKPVVISTSGPLCVANPGGGAPTDWQEIVTQSGTINSQADYAAKSAAGLIVLGNDTSCGEAMGDWDPLLSAGGISSVTSSDSSLTISPTTGAVVASINLAHGNTFTVQQTVNGLVSTADILVNSHALNLRNSGGSQMKILSDASNTTYLGWDFTDVSNGTPFKVSSVTGNGAIGPMAVGTGACFMWTSAVTAAATAFFCNPTANAYTLGSTAGASNGTLTLATVNAALNGAATSLAGTGIDSAPYQSASAITSYITAPTTSGHTFVYAWQPSGSAVAPSALDFSTYLASPPAIGSTAPAPGHFTTLTATGAISAGSSPPTACGSAVGCMALSEGSTAGTPTAGQDYLRPDSTSHTWVQSINGGAETSLPGSLVAIPTPLTAQAANLSAAAIYTAPAANHYYQVCAEANLTQAATTSSTMVQIQIDYTSAIDNVVKVANIGTSPGQTGNGTYEDNSGCVVLYVKASTAIDWATVSYASVGATAMQYSLSGTVQLIQ